MQRKECLNKFPKARVVASAASAEDDDKHPRVPKPELLPLAEGIMKPSSPVRDAPQVEQSQKAEKIKQKKHRGTRHQETKKKQAKRRRAKRQTRSELPRAVVPRHGQKDPS